MVSRFCGESTLRASGGTLSIPGDLSFAKFFTALNNFPILFARLFLACCQAVKCLITLPG